MDSDGMEQNVGLALLATSIEESTNHHSARDLQKPTLKSEFRGHERQVPVPFSGLQAPAPTVRVHVDRSPSHFSARSGGALARACSCRRAMGVNYRGRRH